MAVCELDKCERGIPVEPYYDRGGIVIYNADCRQVLPFLGKSDLLLTDPPYGILSGSKSKGSGAGKLKNRILNRSEIDWDMDPPSIEDLVLLQEKADKQIIWGGNYFDLPACRGLLVWDKCQPWPNFSQVEVAWTNVDKPASLFKHDKSKIDSKTHPTQKPLALMRWCLSFLPDAKTILDPFMGSGTTLVAAKLEGRSAVGIEINEKYCESAAKRLEQGVLF